MMSSNLKEELKILRIRLSLLFEEEMNNRKIDLHGTLDKQANDKVCYSAALSATATLSIDVILH